MATEEADCDADLVVARVSAFMAVLRPAAELFFDLEVQLDKLGLLEGLYALQRAVANIVNDLRLFRGAFFAVTFKDVGLPECPNPGMYAATGVWEAAGYGDRACQALLAKHGRPATYLFRARTAATVLKESQRTSAMLATFEAKCRKINQLVSLWRPADGAVSGGETSIRAFFVATAADGNVAAYAFGWPDDGALAAELRSAGQNLGRMALVPPRLALGRFLFGTTVVTGDHPLFYLPELEDPDLELRVLMLNSLPRDNSMPPDSDGQYARLAFRWHITYIDPLEE